MSAENETDKAKLKALGVFNNAWEINRDLSPEDAEVLKDQGLSDVDISRFWGDYTRSMSFRTDRRGGYTQLPELRPDEKKDLIGGDLAGFVESYVSWAELPDDERRSDEEEVQWLLDIGEVYLGNRPHETKHLLGWMQEHPGETADYLEGAWSMGKIHTERFRDLTRLKMLPKLEIPPDKGPTT